MSSDALTAVDGPTAVAEATELDEETAEKILYIVESRENNRSSSNYDIIILLEEWAYEPWSDIDIANQEALVVGHIRDHSEKAYFVESGFEVQMDVIENKSLKKTKATYITSLVQQIDNTDEEFHDEKGEMYLPKSAVSKILVYEP